MDYNLGQFRVRPRGEFSPEERYRYLDIVSYDGGSYICCYFDTIDGTGCIGILPEGEDDSETYWQCIAHKGDKGEDAKESDFGKDNEELQNKLKNNVWDYSLSDKIIIDDDSSSKKLDITNVYDGCVGIIMTKCKNLDLPDNSNYSVDFNYIEAGPHQHYIYSFIYADMGNGPRFNWNRSVYGDVVS